MKSSVVRAVGLFALTAVTPVMAQNATTEKYREALTRLTQG